jgi:molybdate transport system ATP-binding protein
VPARGVLVLVGESGAGKTTLLRLIAGLIEPDAGWIRSRAGTLVDTDAGVHVPPEQRGVGYLAQDYALFPHLSARDNVALGLRARGLHGAALASRAEAALARLGVEALAPRLPRELSGGQQQRVALARAVAVEPDVLLLDEPLAALDLATRRVVRGELHALLAELECATLLVTHSPAEALAFGERIAVLERGAITQQGTRDDLLARPRTRYVAEFLGTNLFTTTVRARDPDGLLHLDTAGATIVAVDGAWAVGDAVFAVVDPRDVTLLEAAEPMSARNVWRGRVVDAQPEPPSGDRWRVRLDTRPALVAEITRVAAERMDVRVGADVVATFKATGVRLFA